MPMTQQSINIGLRRLILSEIKPNIGEPKAKPNHSNDAINAAFDCGKCLASKYNVPHIAPNKPNER